MSSPRSETVPDSGPVPAGEPDAGAVAAPETDATPATDPKPPTADAKPPADPEPTAEVKPSTDNAEPKADPKPPTADLKPPTDEAKPSAAEPKPSADPEPKGDGKAEASTGADAEDKAKKDSSADAYAVAMNTVGGPTDDPGAGPAVPVIPPIRPSAAARARRIRRLVVLGVAAVILLAATAVTAVGALTARDSGDRANEAFVNSAVTAEVLGQVTEAITTVYSYDYTSLPANEAAAKAVITGKFAGDFSRVFEPVKQLAPGQQAILRTTVRAAGVSLLQDDRARLLMMVDQSGVRGAAREPTGATARLVVDAQKVDGRWKISEVTPE